MGTTVVAVIVSGRDVYIAHVGDSRAYVVTPEGIEQALLRQNMTTRVETALKDTALVTGPDGVTDYVIPEFRLTDFSAPLGRSYEIRFRILFPNAGPWITEQ